MYEKKIKIKVMQMIFYVFYIDFIPTAKLNLISILKNQIDFLHKCTCIYKISFAGIIMCLSKTYPLYAEIWK